MNLTKQKTELRRAIRIAFCNGMLFQAKGNLTNADAKKLKRESIVIAYEALDTIASAAREEAIKNAIKSLPEELGYDDYDKHMHSYVHENRGKCEICGLSWKMAGQYELYNNGIIACKKVLRSHLKEKQK